jgi:hypothetical protein
MVNSDTQSQTVNDPEAVDARLCVVLSESLNELAMVGHADTACRLAGRACALLRGRNPSEWARFNKLLHRLSPMSGDIGVNRLS